MVYCLCIAPLVQDPAIHYYHLVQRSQNLLNQAYRSYLKDNYNGIYFVQNSINLGFGKANNIGLKYAIDNNYNIVF